jgi:hypothetical protein
MANKIYTGDKGTDIVLDTQTNLTGALVTNIRVIKPDGSVVTWPGSVVNDTKIKYTTSLVDSELDLPGRYLLQAFVDTGVWSGHGETVSMTVSSLGF